MDAITTTNATLTAVAKALDYFKENVLGHMTDSSLTSITKLTRAEPLTIISQDCANLPELPDLLNAVVSIYSGYFLQAIAMLTRINDIETIRILDRLNPDRDSTGFLLGGRLATENVHTLLKSNYTFSLPLKSVMAMEGVGDTDADPRFDQANAKSVYETANLAIGKLLSVDLLVSDKDGCSKTVKLPISVRLSPAIVNLDTLTHIFTHRKGDTGIVERWHSMRAGRISLINDMIFCQDLINEYRRAAIKDTSGTMAEIVRRATNARSFGLLTKNPSLAASSNIYILSSDTAKAIEAKVGQKFSSAKGRETILEHTYAMLIAIVDQEWGHVTFYFNGIAYPSTLRLNALKSGGKDKGPDIADVMRTLLEGRAPTF